MRTDRAVCGTRRPRRGAKSNYHYETPFLWLARKCVGSNSLVFAEEPPLRGPMTAERRAIVYAFLDHSTY